MRGRIGFVVMVALLGLGCANSTAVWRMGIHGMSTEFTVESVSSRAGYLDVRLQGKAPLSGSSRNLTAHIVDGGAADAPNPGGLRRRGGLGASLDEHAQLRMELLVYEWTESVSKIEAQIGDLREQLKSTVPSGTGATSARPTTASS